MARSVFIMVLLQALLLLSLALECETMGTSLRVDAPSGSGVPICEAAVAPSSLSIDWGSADGVDDLKDWLQRLGAIIHPCLRVEGDNNAGRRLRMTCDTKPEDGLFSLPSSALIWPTTNTSCLKKTRAWKQSGKQSEKAIRRRMRLMMKLVGERQLGAAGQFAPYFRMLPQSFPTFGQHEAALHRCFRAQPDWLRRHFDMQALQVDAIQTCAGVSEVEASWALHIVERRAFKAGGDSLLVPFADFMNHQSVRPNTWYRSTDNSEWPIEFSLNGAGVPNGSEITLSYGDVANDGMMLKYGMAMPENPNDVTTVLVVKDPTPVILSVGRLESEASKLPGTLKELRALMPSGVGEAKEVEVASFMVIRHACERLSAGEAPAADDDSVCVVYRDGLVQMLKACVEFAQQAMDLLDGGKVRSPLILQPFWDVWKKDVQDRLPESVEWAW